MSASTSPSPPPRPNHQPQSQLLPSSIFSTPSFSSTLPLPRPTSASGAFRRSSMLKKGRLGSSQQLRRTRSVASSMSHSSDGSLGDFSMENYTIDLAQLAKSERVAPPVGFERAFQGHERTDEREPRDFEVAPNGNEPSRAETDEEGSLLGDYTIDLGGLGDKPSSMVVTDLEKDRDEVGSEDEGPEDFTVNLEKWMRGGEQWNKEQPDGAVAEGDEANEDPQEYTQELRIDPGLPEESVFEPIGTSTPAALRSHAIIEEGVEEEARIKAPPMPRTNTKVLQDQAAEEVFERISALQAEVEKMRIEDEERRLAYQEIEQENELLRNESVKLLERHQDEKDMLQNQQSRLREHWKEQLRLKDQELAASHTPKVASLRAKFELAVLELATLKADAESDRFAAEAKIKALEEQLHAVQEDLVLREDAKASVSAADDRIRALEEQLQAAHNETRRFQNQLTSIQEADEATVKRLSAELETKNNEIALERKESIHRGNEAASLTERIDRKDQELRTLNSELKAMKMEFDHAHEQLTETRRIVETVEHENDRLVQQNDRQAQDIVDLENCIKNQDVKEASEPLNTETSSRHHVEAGDFDEADHKDARERIEQFENTISSMKATHAKEIQTLRSAFLKASEGMQKREARFTKAHSKELASLNGKLATFQKQQTELSTSAENELRSAIRVLNAKLERANTALEASEVEAEEARQAAEDSQRNNAIVNAELEARFAEAVEVREREWRRRVQLLFKEREKMGKALMWGWGREEEGPKGAMERAQPYRYKFVKKS